MGLFDDQGDLIIVLRRKKDIGFGSDDLGQLGTEIPVFRGKGFEGGHRSFSVYFFKCLFEKFSQSFGVIAGNIIENRCFPGSQFFSGKIG